MYDHLYNMIDSVGFARTVPQINTNTPATVTLALAIHRVFRMVSDTVGLTAFFCCLYLCVCVFIAAYVVCPRVCMFIRRM